MKVIYALSVLIIFTLAILIKKKEEKIDIITSLFVGGIILFCYNILECLTVRIFAKNIELLPLAIINFIISAVLLYKIIKDKSIQKFYIKLKDIFAVLIISVVAITVLLLTFGYPFKISFICTDAANHYEMITDFFMTGEIEPGIIAGSNINYGLIFKVLYDINNKIVGYNIFIILEIIKLIFSGVLFYLTIRKFIKTKFSYFISIVISLLYMLAYPLNGILSGFVYFQIAVNIIGAILIVMTNYEDISNKLKNILLFLLTFGLMFTYYILVPPVYIALFLFELKTFKKSKLTSIINILKIFLIPSLSGILFFIILPKLGMSRNEFKATSVMQLDGYIFVNYFTNFIFFIPFNVYYLIDNIKKKRIDGLSLILIFNVLYIILAVILKEKNILSRYYAMKPYYTLWLIMLTITAITILNILSSKIQKAYKFITVIPIVLYIILIITFCTVKGTASIKIFEYKDEDINSMFDIYRINLGIIIHNSFEVTYFDNEIEFICNIGKNFNDDTKIYYQESDITRLWFKNLLLIKEEDDMNKGEIFLDRDSQDKLIDKIKNSEEEIFIVVHDGLYNNLLYRDFNEKLYNNFSIMAQEGRLTIFTNK